MSGASYEVDTERPRGRDRNLVFSEFRQIRKSRKFRKSAMSGEFEAALLDVQSLDGSSVFPGWSNISSIATREARLRT